MFKLQIEVDSIEEAERIISCLKHSADPAAVRQVVDQVAAGATLVEALETHEAAANPPADKPKRGRPRREVAAPLPESAAPAPSGSDLGGQAPGTTGDAPAPQTLTAADVRAALQALLTRKDGDMAPCTALLGQFKAARVSEIDPADYAAFVAQCEAA